VQTEPDETAAFPGGGERLVVGVAAREPAAVHIDRAVDDRTRGGYSDMRYRGGTPRPPWTMERQRNRRHAPMLRRGHARAGTSAESSVHRGPENAATPALAAPHR
jgi:hypothetical protein